MARLTAASADTMLDSILVAATVYNMGLNTADPGTTGASEVTGGSYGRQAITFSAASGSSKASGGTDAAQAFTGMPNVAVTFFSVWSTGGTYICGGTASVNGGSAVPAASTVSFASGAVTFTQS